MLLQCAPVAWDFFFFMLNHQGIVGGCIPWCLRGNHIILIWLLDNYFQGFFSAMLSPLTSIVDYLSICTSQLILKNVSVYTESGKWSNQVIFRITELCNLIMNVYLVILLQRRIKAGGRTHGEKIQNEFSEVYLSEMNIPNWTPHLQ